jgi:hypothetical protein
MKIRSLLIATLALVIGIPTWCAAPSASTAFTTLTNLAGEWQLTGAGANPQPISWKLISGGSVLMETFPAENMVTMYHMDNDRLMMMHYCEAKNQPRMQASVSEDGKTFTFDFLDATNLPDPANGHMHKMVLVIRDKDHFTEEWFFSQNGKDADHGVFHLARKK